MYLSQTHNKTTDPLNWDFKRRVCESAFPGVNISNDKSIKNPYHALKEFLVKYDRAIFVVGGDRVDEFTERMTPYAKEWGIVLEVKSAGKRVDEGRGINGVSGTKMREFAATGQKEKFLKWLPSNLKEGVKSLIYSRVRKDIKKTE